MFERRALFFGLSALGLTCCAVTLSLLAQSADPISFRLIVVSSADRATQISEQDIYLGTGSPSYVSLVPSMLLRNRNGTSFADVTMSSGTGEMHKGHGVAFADLDNGGDQEIAFKVGGATPGDAHAFRLFENPGHGNDWLGVLAIGVKSNRAAIGARITVTVERADGSRREIHRTVNSGGSFGASPLQQHFGLGSGWRVVEVQVSWPATGTPLRRRDQQSGHRNSRDGRSIHHGGPSAAATWRGAMMPGSQAGYDSRPWAFVSRLSAGLLSNSLVLMPPATSSPLESAGF